MSWVADGVDTLTMTNAIWYENTQVQLGKEYQNLLSDKSSL